MALLQLNHFLLQSRDLGKRLFRVLDLNIDGAVLMVEIRVLLLQSLSAVLQGCCLSCNTFFLGVYGPFAIVLE